MIFLRLIENPHEQQYIIQKFRLMMGDRSKGIFVVVGEDLQRERKQNHDR